MKLDRNLPFSEGIGKYALLKLRQLSDHRKPGPFGGGLPPDLDRAIQTLELHGVIDWGDKPETEFFVMRLKDKYAAAGLMAYAHEAFTDDPEYAEEIIEMAKRAGKKHPLCKVPD